jgi:hypothetical protein
MADDMEKNRQQGGQSGQQGNQSGQPGQSQTGGQPSQKKGGQGTDEDEDESLNRQRRAS